VNRRTLDFGFQSSAITSPCWSVAAREPVGRLRRLLGSAGPCRTAKGGVGQYNLVSWALNSFGVPVDDFLSKGGP
jgi:hypothetical protein